MGCLVWFLQTNGLASSCCHPEYPPPDPGFLATMATRRRASPRHSIVQHAICNGGDQRTLGAGIRKMSALRLLTGGCAGEEELPCATFPLPPSRPRLAQRTPCVCCQTGPTMAAAFAGLRTRRSGPRRPRVLHQTTAARNESRLEYGGLAHPTSSGFQVARGRILGTYLRVLTGRSHLRQPPPSIHKKSWMKVHCRRP